MSFFCTPRRRLIVALAAISFVASGCDRLDMYDQPRYEPLEASGFFSDGSSARLPVEGTVARGHLKEDEAFHFGKQAGQPIVQIPEAAWRAAIDRGAQPSSRADGELDSVAIRRAMLERGRERFEIHCAPCHGLTGEGEGMIVRRGFRRPPSYHTDRLRNAAAGYLFDVVSNGFGAMSPYGSRINATDRWAIVSYIRALQLSRHAAPDDLTDEQRQKLSQKAFRAGDSRSEDRP